MSSGSSGANPVLSMMQQADRLAQSFDETHKHTLPVVQDIVATVSAPTSAVNEEPNERLERQLSHLRVALTHMEARVEEMMSMLYHVDVFLAAPTQTGVSGKDPKTALEHISDLFHMYQSELMEKREALSDLTCEECSVDQFAARWSSMDQVHAGRKQTMDDLADLLAGLG